MNPEKELIDSYRNDDAYEYVRFISEIYYPDYPDPLVYGDSLPIEELAQDGSDKEFVEADNTQKPSKHVCYGSPGGFKIVERIVQGKASFLFTKEEYFDYDDIQKSLLAIGLDVEKFWHVLLFIHHMAELDNTGCKPEQPSIHDKIQKLICALRSDRTVVLIKSPGKKPITLNDQETVDTIAYFLEYGDELYHKQHDPVYSGRRALLENDYEKQGIRWRIYDEYRAFKIVFKEFCTDGDLPTRSKVQEGSRDKDLLISRLLFFTGVTDNSRYEDNRDALHSDIQYCKTHERPLKSSGFFW